MLIYAFGDPDRPESRPESDRGKTRIVMSGFDYTTQRSRAPSAKARNSGPPITKFYCMPRRNQQ